MRMAWAWIAQFRVIQIAMGQDVASEDGEKDGQVGAKVGHFVGPLVNAVRGSLYSRRICRRKNF